MVKKVINSKNGQVFYWISEEKKDKCMFFTHGLTADHTLFDKQIEFWSREYTVIVWDMPLHGESRNYKNFSYANAAEEMKRILDVENITHSVMAGQSAGGYIVQEFIRRYPKMCDAFISIDSSPLGLKYYSRMDLFSIRNAGKIIRLYPYGYYCKVASEGCAVTKEAQESFAKSLERLGKKALLIAMNTVYNDFSNYDEVNFNCPVLLILGEFDKVGKVKKYNEMWNAEKGYKLIIIKNAGHNSNYDNYREFNDKVYEFLQKRG